MKSEVGRNTLWLLIARLGTQGLLAAFTIIIARRLGETGLGQYAFLASVVFVANALTTFGTDMLLIREIAAGSGLSQLPNALMIQLGLSTLFVIGIWLVTAWLPNLDDAPRIGLRIYGLALFPLSFFTIFTTALRGLQKMDWYTLLNLAVSIVQTVGAWIFVQPANGIVSVTWVLTATQLLAAILAGCVCGFVIPDFLQDWQFSWKRIPALVKSSAPIAWLSVLGMIYQRVSIYQLTAFVGVAATGAFSGAARIVEASKTGHLAMFGALYPVMAQEHPPTHSTIRNSGRLLFILAGLGSLVMYLISEPLVRLLFGAGFDSAIAALRILAWQLIPYTVSTYLSLRLVATGREHWVGRALAISVVLLVGLNLWWVPTAGFTGACWAALVAEVVLAILLIYADYRSKATDP